MKKSFPLLFTLVAASYSASVYSYDDAYHVLSSRIDIIQGAEIYGNGQMQSIVRVRYELDKDVTMESITLKEFGTGAELASIGWESSVTDKGFDHNIGRVTRHSHTQAAFKSNEKHKNIYVSTENKNSNLNVCYDIETTKNSVQSTHSTCFDDDVYNGTVNIFSRRPPYYSGSDFQFIKDSAINTVEKVSILSYYVLKNGFSIPSGTSFKLKKKVVLKIPNVSADETSDFEINLHENTSIALRKFNQFSGILSSRSSAYLYKVEPSKKYKLTMYDYYNYHVYNIGDRIDVPFESRNEIESPVHILVNRLFQTAVYHQSYLCIDPYPTYPKESYVCRNQLDGKSNTITKKKIAADPVGKSHEEILIDNYGTEHPITIRVGDDHAPTL